MIENAHLGDRPGRGRAPHSSGRSPRPSSRGPSPPTRRRPFTPWERPLFRRGPWSRVFRLKGGTPRKPLSVHRLRHGHGQGHRRFAPSGLPALAEEFWPGPLTLVLPAAAGLPEFLLGPGRTIAVRIPPLAVAAGARPGDQRAADGHERQPVRGEGAGRPGRSDRPLSTAGSISSSTAVRRRAARPRRSWISTAPERRGSSG